MKSTILFALMAMSFSCILGLTSQPLKYNDVAVSKNTNSSISLNNDTNLINSSKSILSYVDVLNTYYELAIGDSNTPSKTFGDFYSEYYAEDSDRNLYKFTLDLAKENDNFDNVYSVLYDDEKYDSFSYDAESYSSSSSSSGDADYILSDSTDYSSTPSSAFVRQPSYSSYDYSSIKTGDIVWETDTIFFDAEHNALIVDIEHDSDYGSYIQTIESVGGGVQRGFLDDLRMAEYKCEILRVRGRTTSKANDAIYFATAQLGKPYSLWIFRLNTSIDSTEWYCSELVYASWNYAGIDIGVKDGNYLKYGCLPSDIANSDNTYELSVPYYDFLTLGIVSKDDNVWNIKITNTCSVDLSVEYNKKMCFKNDAKNWANLSDNGNVSIEANSTVTVQISENWWATSIVASYIKGEYRYITYADNLDDDTKTLSEYQNIITAVVEEEDD